MRSLRLDLHDVPVERSFGRGIGCRYVHDRGRAIPLIGIVVEDIDLVAGVGAGFSIALVRAGGS